MKNLFLYLFIFLYFPSPAQNYLGKYILFSPNSTSANYLIINADGTFENIFQSDLSINLKNKGIWTKKNRRLLLTEVEPEKEIDKSQIFLSEYQVDTVKNVMIKVLDISHQDTSLVPLVNIFLDDSLVKSYLGVAEIGYYPKKIKVSIPYFDFFEVEEIYTNKPNSNLIIVYVWIVLPIKDRLVSHILTNKLKIYKNELRGKMKFNGKNVRLVYKKIAEYSEKE